MKKLKKRNLFVFIIIIGAIWGLSAYFTDTFLKREPIKIEIKDEYKINAEDYPEDLITALNKNADLLPFVKGYKAKKGKVFKDDIGHVQKGVFPLLLQYDEGWGYGLYGGEVLALTGCGPTVIAMAYAGLTGKNDLTPYVIAKYAEENGYFQKGTTWSMMQSGINHFGLQSRELGLDENLMVSELSKGHPLIVSVGPGDFTSTGHFILLSGYSNGMFKVNDPNSKKRSNKPWSYEKLKPQIKNLWAIYL